MKTVGMIVSGCGQVDGSDVAETHMMLWAAAAMGAEVRVFAPEGRLDVFDPRTGKPTGEQRSILHEAQRLMHIPVAALHTANAPAFDAWLLPGGGGCLRTLTDFTTRGAHCSAHKDVARVLRDAFAAEVGVGASSTAPLVLAAAAKSSSRKLVLTVGADNDAARALTSMGHAHRAAAPDEIVVDEDARVVSTAGLGVATATLITLQQACTAMVRELLRDA
jgi:enhancing lycopene biosynthesis protein 2